MDFGIYLEDLIRERGLSIHSLSNDCNINRGNLYSVFKHQRKLKAEQLFVLISRLALTPAEEKKLKTLYFQDLYGNTAYEKIQFFLVQMQTCMPESSSEQMQPDPNSQAVEAVARFLHGNSRVLTNFPFAFSEVDALFYEAVKSGTCKELKHMFALEEKDDYKQKYSSFFKTIKYMKLRQFPFYYYTTVTPLEENVLLPYFAIGDKSALLFSRTEAVEIRDEKALAMLTEKAEHLLARCTKLGTMDADIMQLKNACKKGLSKGDISYVVSDYPCLAQYVDYETMQSAVRPELPNKEALVEIAYAHYKNIYRLTKQINVCTEQGITRFAETGNFSEISGDFIRCVDAAHRIKILQQVRQAVEQDDFYILDKSKIVLPKGLVLEKCANQVFVFYNEVEQERFCSYDLFYAQMQDYAFVNDMKLTAEYMIESRMVCPKEYALQFIDTLLATLGTGL